MTELARAEVVIGGNDTDLQNTLARASKSMGQAGKKMQRIGTRMSATLTAPLVAVGAAAVKMASDAEESANKFDVVMGAAADRTRERLHELTETIPLTTAQVEAMAAGIQDMLVPMGVLREDAAGMSADMVQLAGDLASFNNVDPTRVLEAMQSALAGSSEPMRRFGVDTRVARLETLALREGLIEAGEELDNAATAQAVMLAIQEDSTDAMGDAARTADSTANRMKFLARDVKQLGIDFGQTLLPAARDFLAAAQGLIERFNDLSPAVRTNIARVAALAAAIGPLLLVTGSLMRAVQGLTAAFVTLTGTQIGSAVAGWAASFAALAVQVRSVSGAMALLSASIGGIATAGIGIVVGLGIKKALDDWGDAAERMGERMDRAREKIDSLVDKASELTRAQTAELLSSLGAQATTLEQQLEDARRRLNVVSQPMGDPTEAREARMQVELLEEQLQGVRDAMEEVGQQGRRSWDLYIGGTRDANDATGNATDAVQDLIDGLQEQFNELRFTERQLLEYRLSTEGASAADRDHALSLFEKVQALKRLASEMTPLNQLMRAATQATSMFGVAISGLPDSFEGVFDAAFRQAESAFDRFSDLTERMMSTREELTKIKEDARKHVADLQSDIALAKLQDQLRETRQIARDFASSFTDAFMSIIDGSKSLAEAFGDMIQSLIADMARAMIQKALFNVVMGFFGDGIPDAPGPIPEPAAPNFEGGFASGGTIPSGSFGVVGERGPELVTGPAKVVPMESGGGREVHIHEAPTNINIAAVDAASFREFAERNADVFAAATAKGAGTNTGLRRAILAGR